MKHCCRLSLCGNKEDDRVASSDVASSAVPNNNNDSKFKNGRISTLSYPRTSGHSGIPTFEQVLQGEIPMEPWVPATFLDFLRSELNDENFYFFEEVEAFKAARRNTRPPPEDFLLLPQEIRSNDSKYVLELINTFVKENSPRQVNISSDQRTKLLEEVENAVEQGYQPEMFEEAQLEVKKLMQMDSWPRFMKKALTENVSREDGYVRFKHGLMWMFVAALALALMLGFLVPRWYIFILFLPIMNAIQHMVTWKTNLCFRNAALGVRDRDGSVNARVTVACPIVRMNQKTRAKKLFVLVLLVSMLITGLSFALTYIIEAGQGKVLYG